MPYQDAEDCAEMLVWLKRAVPANVWVTDLVQAGIDNRSKSLPHNNV